MNTGKLKLALATLLISGIIFSCKKEKNNEGECKISMSSLSGTYKMISIKYKENSNAPGQDFLALMDDCFKDDLVTLSSAGTYNLEDAGTTCSPDNSNSGEWALHGNTLISDGVLNGTISSFDCKTLVYHLDDMYITGDSFIYELVKQ